MQTLRDLATQEAANTEGTTAGLSLHGARAALRKLGSGQGPPERPEQQDDGVKVRLRPCQCLCLSPGTVLPLRLPPWCQGLLTHCLPEQVQADLLASRPPRATLPDLSSAPGMSLPVDGVTGVHW